MNRSRTITHHARTQLMMAFIATLFALCIITSASAQDAALTRDAAYQQLLANPSDIALTLKYAKLCAAAGDYEAAIPPLERLLISKPDSPKLRLEIGILYYLLGSFDTAKTYLKDAKKDPTLTAKADDYLSRM